jgi:prefoldin subunit 5
VKTRESINSLFIGAEATVPQEILAKVNEKLDSFSKEIHRIIGQASTTIGNTLSMDSGTSPLQALKNDLITSSQDLNKQLTDKIDDVKAKVEAIDTRRQLIMNSTKKGMPYEEAVFEVLSQFATASGDEAVRTGQTWGLIKNCMKGDVTVAVNRLAARGNLVNVVFEAKSMAMSRDEWRKELNVAMTNRAAEVSVAVVQFVDQMPSKSRVSIQDNQQLLVAFDPETDDPAVLGCIYNIAKAYAVSRSFEGTQVSFKVIQESLEHLQASLSDLENIEGAVRTARKSLEKIDSARISIKGTIENQSQRLSGLIGSSTESEVSNA